MIKVKQLYAIVSDDDGHNYLVPKDDYAKFNQELMDANRNLNRYIESVGFDIHNADEYYVDELQSAIDQCYDELHRIEGEKYYVVLKGDITNDK